MTMLSSYISKKLKEARYKILKDGTYFGAVPTIKGVWANARTLENCRTELTEVLEDWVVLKVRNREKVSGLEIKFDRRNLVKNG